MTEPKYQVGQQVEAQWSGLTGYEPATITEITHSYTVKFDRHPYDHSARTENQIRLPRPSVEEAWEKATLLIGMRGELVGWGTETFDTGTRHQCYQVLGSAGIRITDEVKAHVRRLIDMAADMLP